MKLPFVKDYSQEFTFCTFVKVGLWKNCRQSRALGPVHCPLTQFNISTFLTLP